MDQIIPTELIEIILGYLSNVDTIILIINELRTTLNWGTIYQYHFNTYKNVPYLEYLSDLKLENLRNKLGLSRELDQFRVDTVLYEVEMIEIKHIPKEINAKLNLEVIELTHYSIENIADEIGDLINLKIINLAYNCITKIPSSIDKLRNLISLKLSNNFLTEISIGICSLYRLQSLDLSNNQINLIPSSIVNLISLQRLNLNGNKISVIPHYIERLRKLTELLLCDNSDVIHIQVDLGAMTNLVNLQLKMH